MTGEEAEPFLGDACMCFSLFDPTKLSLSYHVQKNMYTVLARHFLMKKEGVWPNRKKKLNRMSLLKMTDFY